MRTSTDMLHDARASFKSDKVPPSPFQLQGISQRWGWLSALCGDAPWGTPRLRRPIRQLKIRQLDQLWAAGFVLIFTDGSSEKHPTLGDIAGYGVYSHLFSQGQEVLVKAG